MRRGRARRFGYAGLACVLAVGAVVAIPGLSRSILPFNHPPGAHPAPATDGTGQFSHNTNGGDGPSGGSGNGDGNGSNANGGNPGNHPSGNGSGTGVTASVGNVVAKPSSYQGSCPAAVTLNAIIGVNHGPATVTYRWVRGDGTTSSSQTVEFPSGGAQTRQVTTTWQLGSPSTTTTGWGAVELQTPNPAQSTHANFTLTCAPPPPPPPCTFSVAPASVHLGPTESHLSVTLHAGARQLVWRSPTPAVTAVFLDRTSGTVKAGGSDTVTGSVSREALYQGTAPVTFTADCGERHTVSVTWDAAPPPPPAVHTSGDLSIPETYQADLDEGVVPGSGSDIWFEEAGPPTERYITPQNGATIAVTSTLATSPEQCAQAPLGTARIPMTTLDTGSTLCARTNQGRYSAVTLTGMPGPIPGTLTIHFTTWE